MAAAHLTVTDLAARTGTSEATVVRTARSLGFAGYPQLRLALAAAGPAPAPAALFTESPEDAPDLAGVVATLTALESEALHATARTLDLAALDAAADTVHRARPSTAGASRLGVAGRRLRPQGRPRRTTDAVADRGARGPRQLRDPRPRRHRARRQPLRAHPGRRRRGRAGRGPAGRSSWL